MLLHKHINREVKNSTNDKINALVVCRSTGMPVALSTTSSC